MSNEVTTLGLAVDSTQVKTATSALDTFAAAGGRAETATSRLEKSFVSMARVGATAFVGTQVVGAFKNATAAIYEASAAAERFRTTLDFASGGNGTREIEYLRAVTQRLGLEFQSTAKAYASFQAASKGTALEGAKARAVFESIAKASAVMGLSSEQSAGALQALQQMVSKGTVQAEELRGQLGERLPGAFQIAAKAMGVTTQELGKMLEQGLVVADDFLPKFAKALEENLGDAAERAAGRLDASVNRLSNAFERLKQGVGDSGISAALSNELSALARDLTAVTETMEGLRASGSGTFAQLAAGAGVGAARLGFEGLNAASNALNASINFLSGGFIKLDTNLALMPDALKTTAQQARATAVELVKAEAELKTLQDRGAATSDNIYLRSSYFQLVQYIDKLKEAKVAQDGLTIRNPRDQSGFTSRSQSADAEEKRLAGIQTAMQKVLGPLSGVKDGFLKDLNSLYAGYQAGLLNLGDYQKAVAKLIKDSGGGKAAEDASKKVGDSNLEAQIGKIKGQLGLLTSAYADAESILEAQRQAGLTSEADYYEAKRAFIRLEEESQVAALRAINAQLAADSKRFGANTPEAIENSRKIAENTAKITELNNKAAASTEVLGIKQSSALGAAKKAYEDAERAAQEYFDTLKQGQDRDLALFGASDAQRQKSQARSQISDRYDQERRRLQNERSALTTQQGGSLLPEQERQFDEQLRLNERFRAQALAEWESYYTSLEILQSDSSMGASRAMANYLAETQNVAKQTEDLVTRAFGGMEDALVNFVRTGKLDFRSLADSIISDLIRIQVRKTLAGIFGNDGVKSAVNVGLNFLGLPTFAAGGAHAGGARIVGERGPELEVTGPSRIFNASQTAQILSQASGGGGANIKVEIVNPQGQPQTGTQTTTQQPDGTTLIRVVLKAVADDMSSGGVTARAAKSRFPQLQD